MEAKKPLITFIITTYNLPAHYLLRCIDSVFSSSLNKDEFEIVLVDDGSKSKVLPELKQYRNTIRYIIKELLVPEIQALNMQKENIFSLSMVMIIF